jgi:hypothetical protein
MFAHEKSFNLVDSAFFAGFLLTVISWLVTATIGTVHVLQFLRRRARDLHLKVYFILVIIMPMAFVTTWSMMFFGSLILDCPWETAILVYEPVAMLAFLFVSRLN